ncbi:hypothetical protein ACFVMC_00435 [Nocardia sp. NPDC127579]|uniref:hypothetical protein n=1 Tax=Nocardia sp. NPDC127579 TaxID=3345402 RepID=UPI00363C944A
MIEVLVLPGTGHPRGGDGVSEAFMAALDPARFRPRIVAYPAAYGDPMPYGRSRELGRAALITAIRATPELVVIAGYSQGAGIAGDLAAEISTGVLPDLEVLGCALIADPARPSGSGCPGAPTASGYGVAGQRPIPGIPTWWAAAEGDPITALPAGNPLRSVADLSEWYGLSSPDAVCRWGEDLVELVRERTFQRWWSVQHWRSWAGAMAYARGYLVDGRHGADYVRHGHVQALAAAVNDEVG